MKPVDYSKTSMYGDAMARARAEKSMSGSPIRNGPVEMETAFYQQGMEQSLKLGELGLRKEMFEKDLGEKKRQFDLGMAEGQRQFKMNMDFSRDQFKYQRRQDNRAELIAMSNIGIGLGMGYLQYKQNRRQIEMNKMMAGLFANAQRKK